MWGSQFCFIRKIGSQELSRYRSQTQRCPPHRGGCHDVRRDRGSFHENFGGILLLPPSSPAANPPPSTREADVCASISKRRRRKIFAIRLAPLSKGGWQNRRFCQGDSVAFYAIVFEKTRGAAIPLHPRGVELPPLRGCVCFTVFFERAVEDACPLRWVIQTHGLT